MESLPLQVAQALRERASSFEPDGRLPQKYAARYAIAEERALAAARKVQSHITPQMRDRWSRLLGRVSAGRLAGGRAIEALWEVADELCEVAARHSACRAGCAHCCHIPVALSQSEAAVISRQIRVKAAAVPSGTTAPRHTAGYENPCPFLREGRCGIYRSRPLACRLHFNLDQDAMLCELVDGDTISVPYLDVSQIQTAYAMAAVLAADGMADIRDFFPSLKKRSAKRGDLD